MKKVVCSIIGVAIAIAVLGIGFLGNDEYIREVNAQSFDQAYETFYVNGYIDQYHKYEISREHIDDKGVVKLYKLTVKNGGVYYYPVSA